MSEMVERSSLDLRYESYRLRSDVAEARLMASIAERGSKNRSVVSIHRKAACCWMASDAIGVRRNWASSACPTSPGARTRRRV